MSNPRNQLIGQIAWLESRIRHQRIIERRHKRNLLALIDKEKILLAAVGLPVLVWAIKRVRPSKWGSFSRQLLKWGVLTYLSHVKQLPLDRMK